MTEWLYLSPREWNIASPRFQNYAAAVTMPEHLLLFQMYRPLLDKAGLGSITSVRFLGDQQRVFLSKDLLKPIQVKHGNNIKPQK